MFNWTLFVSLGLVCVPGLLVVIPNLIQSLGATLADKMRPGKTLPSHAVLVAAAMAQSLLLVAVASAVGTALAPRVGLAAPFFTALVSGQSLWDAAVPQLLPALLLGVGGALVIVAAYYLFFRPRLDAPTVAHMEGLRMELGFGARLLYGGIVEEVLFRWGVLTLLAWIGAALFGGATPIVMWGAIAISGVLFGLGHLPSYRMAGCQVTPLFLSLMIVLNLWATLICGWLFWQYGLLAAMLAHMLYHLVWLPFDLHFAGRNRSAGVSADEFCIYSSAGRKRAQGAFSKILVKHGGTENGKAKVHLYRVGHVVRHLYRRRTRRFVVQHDRQCRLFRRCRGRGRDWSRVGRRYG